MSVKNKILFELQHRAIESGTVVVNGKPTTPDHVIQNGDFILNKVHRYGTNSHDHFFSSDPQI